MARGQRGILSGRHIRDGEEMRRRARSPVSVRARETATKTWLGLVPQGNTGGANVSPFKPMAIPDDLAELIDVAR